MDQNLTFAQNLIRLYTPDALEGHTVVVLKRAGASGETFRYQLKPGQKPPGLEFDVMALFRGEGNESGYLAFAVTDHTELRTAVITAVTTDDQKHVFSTTVTASFRVADPRLLVSRRNDDPLQKLQTEMGAVVARELAQRDWQDLRHSFRETEQDVIPNVLPPLRRFAESYGFWIESLALAVRLGEQDMRLIEQEAEAELASERRKIELKQIAALRSQEATVKAYERQDMVFKAAAEATAEAIRRVPSSINSVAELAKSFETLARYSGNSGEFTRRLLENSNSGSLDPVGGPGALIGDMLHETEGLTCSTGQKRRTQSAILHLVAELLLEEPTDQTVDQYRQRVVSLCGSANGDETGTMARFSNMEWLHGQLMSP